MPGISCAPSHFSNKSRAGGNMWWSGLAFPRSGVPRRSSLAAEAGTGTSRICRFPSWKTDRHSTAPELEHLFESLTAQRVNELLTLPEWSVGCLLVPLGFCETIYIWSQVMQVFNLWISVYSQLFGVGTRFQTKLSKKKPSTACLIHLASLLV